MTNFQKARIIELRLDNKGYLEIADMLGIPKSTVINFCNHSDFKPICRYCGEMLPERTSKKKRRFCSPSCNQKWWFENIAKKRAEPKKCAYCDEEFSEYKHKSQKFCCRDCYLKSFKKGNL